MIRDSSPKSHSILGSAKVLVSRLNSKFSERESRNLSKILAEHVANRPWSRIMLDPDLTFTPEQYETWQSFAARLLNGEPLQYVTGRAWFGGLSLVVGPGVLIPRPETEELVEWITSTHSQATNLLDVGTGSGCIAISLARALPQARVTGIEFSAAALHYARINVAEHAPQVALHQADIFQIQLDRYAELDVVVSNPPYVLESDRADMAPQVLEYEPELALFVSDQNPFPYYRAIAERAMHWLHPGGWLYFEAHAKLTQGVAQVLRAQGFGAVSIKIDLNGHHRMVRGQRPIGR
ncbi:MAG: peptide chain release factor N(5)-glutamine methyltransferase [Bacteroidota bacterium]